VNASLVDDGSSSIRASRCRPGCAIVSVTRWAFAAI
jgi:hypothetical protein